MQPALAIAFEQVAINELEMDLIQYRLPSRPLQWWNPGKTDGIKPL